VFEDSVDVLISLQIAYDSYSILMSACTRIVP